MGFPKEIDALSEPPDWGQLFRRATEEAAPSDLQRSNVDAIRESRSAGALRVVVDTEPARAFIPTDVGALKKRSLWRIDKAKVAASALFERPVRLRILDLGTGRGELPRFFRQCFPGSEVMGLDIDTSHFEQKRCEDPQYEGVVVIAGGAERIPVADATFDLIVGFNSMEHFDDPKAVVDECARVLRPGGFVYFDFGPPFNSPFGPHLQNRCGLPYFHHLFEREAVLEALDLDGENPYRGKNEWSLQQFDDLFLDHAELDCASLVYECTWEHLWLAREFAEEFARLPPREYVVRAVRVALRKQGDWVAIPEPEATEQGKVSGASPVALVRPPRPKSAMGRKWRKLRTDPERFFRDTRLPLIGRAGAALARWLSKN